MVVFRRLLMTNLIMVVTMPFSVCKLVCAACMSTIFVVIQTWVELVKAAVSFHVNMFWKAVIWTVALLSLPLRLLTALQRERLLEQHLREMQFELETLFWDRKEMKDHLQAAVRERRIVESMLIELEEEHDKAIAKIELLKGELQDLKDENVRLKENQGKAAAWSFTGHDDDDDETKKSKTSPASAPAPAATIDNHHVNPYGISSWISTCKGSGNISLQEAESEADQVMVDTEFWESKGKSSNAGGLMNDFLLKPGPPAHAVPIATQSSVQSLNIITPIMANSSSVNKNVSNSSNSEYWDAVVLEQRREIAVSQTLFSAILSLLVGMIVWEAEDPCMPLVVALFTVVGMSLKSVIQFFFTIRNKPASDAVALLSFNWFILGTLTYPTLPKVSRMLAPLSLTLLHWIANTLGLGLSVS